MSLLFWSASQHTQGHEDAICTSLLCFTLSLCAMKQQLVQRVALCRPVSPYISSAFSDSLEPELRKKLLVQLDGCVYFYDAMDDSVTVDTSLWLDATAC